MLKSILIDSVHINNGGGKVLLEYLVNNLSKSNYNIFYLFDKRNNSNFDFIPERNKYYINNSFLSRVKFYLRNKELMLKVFCFGNIPPPIRLNCNVYTYFHQSLYLENHKNILSGSSLIWNFKIQISKLLKENTNYWIVQTPRLRSKLSSRYKIKFQHIKIIPFFPESAAKNKPIQTSNYKNEIKYIYVSDGHPYKNHIILLKAFNRFYKQFNEGSLILTISENYPELTNLIDSYKQKGIPILNVGFVRRERIIEYLKNAQYLLYPSLNESFGLGIIEAVENECKVIGSNLPFMHEVCEPSIIFNPKSINSIYLSLVYSLKKNVSNSILKTDNKIIDLIELIGENNV